MLQAVPRHHRPAIAGSARLLATLLIAALLSSLTIAACSPQNTNDQVWAASSGNLPRVKELVSQNVSVNARAFDDGQTALIAAARSGRQDIVEFLVANGADVNLKDDAGTPLYWAAFDEVYTQLLLFQIASFALILLPYWLGGLLLAVLIEFVIFGRKARGS
ncbi:ankyrin repeat domain-containing protein [Rhizobacter sp. SG703]|uniref:ankyrin repeat domain-containing protein n=1 Tax=Rhizobacter sp. SG703 TaxID=2587140 RepID=UPI001448731C|nr:ankyrin repeat domain-containing protein [Rhizobacter sp. SG703]NKI97797.1 ankyrin repeat protein [Rhizobacter sp. SG703]